MLINKIVIKLKRDKYINWMELNPVIKEGELIAVTDLPWYKSWFGLKPVRLKYGIGKTFRETKFI
jgi:hypothetical protein